MTESDQNKLPEDYGKIKSPFLSKLENFFYHYKWHTIAVVFLIFTVSICTFQMCQKKTYDLHILYAGGTGISMSAGEGEAESLHSALTNATKRFTSDYDGDGTKGIVLTSLYIPSAEEIKEIENAEGDSSVNYGMIKENKDAFSQYMLYGDYYIVLMSRSLCEELSSRGENNPLSPVSSYLPEDYSEKGYILTSDFGVLLSSTPLADNPGFDRLGDDTVLTIRRYPEINKNKKSEEYHARCEEIFKLMLEDKAAE